MIYAERARAIRNLSNRSSSDEDKQTAILNAEIIERGSSKQIEEVIKLTYAIADVATIRQWKMLNT